MSLFLGSSPKSFTNKEKFWSHIVETCGVYTIQNLHQMCDERFSAVLLGAMLNLDMEHVQYMTIAACTVYIRKRNNSFCTND